MSKILKVEHEINNRLEHINLTKHKLCQVANRAIAQKLNAVSNHPVNTPGIFAYHEGVKAMRDIFVDGETWIKSVENGIEYIVNPVKKIKVIYQNVDYACNPDHAPQPISRRGGTAKRAAISSNQLEMFERSCDPVNVLVICVSENNGIVNGEISRPSNITARGYFSDFMERIFFLQNHNPENINPENRRTNSDDGSDKYDDDILISLKS